MGIIKSVVFIRETHASFVPRNGDRTALSVGLVCCLEGALHLLALVRLGAPPQTQVVDTVDVEDAQRVGRGRARHEALRCVRVALRRHVAAQSVVRTAMTAAEPNAAVAAALARGRVRLLDHRVLGGRRRGERAVG